MSQNQSYFWQTTKRNVYLKRSAKLHMFLALIAVLTFSTICQAELEQHDNEGLNTLNDPTKIAVEEAKIAQQELEKNGLPQKDTKEVPAQTTGFLDAFTASISVILVTELGDKTFFIAAIMAMRHPRLIVFSGAIFALAFMTILSVFFGWIATIIPKVYTYYISTAIFAIFGIKMIYEGYKMKPTDAQEELEEVQSDLRKREDELMRSKRGKYEDAANSDGKRKNSNSDKEDSNSGASSGNVALLATLPKTTSNPEMQHRQRKQPNNYVNNNNNNNNNDNDSIGECNEADVFLENGLHKHENIKMLNFHKVNTSQSSPALSNQTAQTNCDDEFITNSDTINLNSSTNNIKNTPNELLNKKHINRINNTNAAATTTTINGPMTMVHSATISGNFKVLNGSIGNLATGITTGSNQSIHSSTLTGSDGNMRRLERNASALIVQDPESGVIRRNSKKSASYLTTQVFMQAFTMTFIAEWGDRSQLTTILLGASKNVYGVITGGIIGHSICTGLAVIGGRIVATKISVRTVTIIGGIVFLGFALYALIVRPDDI